MLEHITDHLARALARRIEKLKTSVSFADLLSTYLDQVQALEDAFWDLFTNRFLDNLNKATTTTTAWVDGDTGVTLQVVSTDGFPDSGWLTLSANSDGETSFEEDVQYTSKTATSFLLVANNSSHDIGTQVWIPGAKGALLDMLGRVVKEPRGNASNDTEYRKRIRARIRVMLSSGTVEDMYAVVRALFGNDALAKYVPGYPAGFILQLLSPTSNEDVTLLARFIAGAKAAGVSAALYWQQHPDASMFTFGVCTSLSTLAIIGDTSLPLVSTAEFPNSGTLVINEGLADAETVTYTNKNSSSFSLSLPLMKTHGTRSIVSLVNSPGLGFGDTSNPATGGRFAGALGV